MVAKVTRFYATRGLYVWVFKEVIRPINAYARFSVDMRPLLILQLRT